MQLTSIRTSAIQNTLFADLLISLLPFILFLWRDVSTITYLSNVGFILSVNLLIVNIHNLYILKQFCGAVVRNMANMRI